MSWGGDGGGGDGVRYSSSDGDGGGSAGSDSGGGGHVTLPSLHSSLQFLQPSESGHSLHHHTHRSPRSIYSHMAPCS